MSIWFVNDKPQTFRISAINDPESWGFKESTMTVHPDVAEAVEQIDAALFNGDSFHLEGNADVFEQVLQRWLRRIKEIQEME